MFGKLKKAFAPKIDRGNKPDQQGCTVLDGGRVVCSIARDCHCLADKRVVQTICSMFHSEAYTRGYMPDTPLGKIAREVFEGAIEQLKDVIINAAVNKIKPTADSAVKHRLKVEVGVPADLWRNVMTYIPVDVKAVDVPTATFMEKSMRENNENFVENPLTDILL